MKNKTRIIKNKIIWYIKQILPLKFKTTCLMDGVLTHFEWQMFFGRCYGIKQTIVRRENE